MHAAWFTTVNGIPTYSMRQGQDRISAVPTQMELNKHKMNLASNQALPTLSKAKMNLRAGKNLIDTLYMQSLQLI